MGRVQIRRRPERVLHVAYCRESPGATPVATPSSTSSAASPTSTGSPFARQNRVLVAEGKGGSLAAFPPPHTFFFTRESRHEPRVRLVSQGRRGTVRHRRSSGRTRRRVAQYAENFALFNAPPGTRAADGRVLLRQPGRRPSRRARRCMAFTHGDTFKPVAGYKTMVNHFHLEFTDRVARLRIVRHADAGPGGDEGARPEHHRLERFPLATCTRNDPGPVRFEDQKDYFEATRRASDKDFLVTPWEEPSAYFGGHYNIMFPKERVLVQGAPAGTAVHRRWIRVTARSITPASAEDVQQMMDAEGALLVPRAPADEGHDRLSGSDLRQAVHEERSLPGRRVQARHGAGQLRSADVRVALLRRDRHDEQPVRETPACGRSTSSRTSTPIRRVRKTIIYRELPGELPEDRQGAGTGRGLDARCCKALRDGNFFVTTGEILIKSYSVAGTGDQRTITADVEWTYPAVVRRSRLGRRQEIDRQIISATDLGAVRHASTSAIPFDATGKAWVRFAVWDSAGNGAFVQPVWLNRPLKGQPGR